MLFSFSNGLSLQPHTQAFKPHQSAIARLQSPLRAEKKALTVWAAEGSNTSKRNSTKRAASFQEADTDRFVRSTPPISTPMIKAVLSGDLVQLQKLLKENPDGVNVADIHGYTPLTYAAEDSDADDGILHCLLSHKQTNFQKADFARATLFWALKAKRPDIARIFYPEMLNNMHAKDRGGNTALDLAIEYNNPEAIEMLLEAGGKPNPEQSNLYTLVKNGHLNLFNRFIKAGCNVNQASLDGDTPLIRATLYGNTAVVETLIQAGADVNGADRWGYRPLNTAVDFDKIAVVKALIQAGADLNYTYLSINPPVSAAARAGNTAIAETLIQAGADVNRVGPWGCTPLIEASYGGNPDIIKALLHAGAQVNCADEKGTTPLLAASFLNRIDTVKTLIQAGADLNQADRAGNTPLGYARSQGHEALTQFLQEAGAKEPVVKSKLKLGEADIVP
jgi:ankyrin repeat protein